MVGLFFLFVAAWALFGIYRLVRAHERSRRYLEESGQDAPLQLSHLTEPLRSVAMDTRLLRVSLESPLQEIADFVAGNIDRNAEDVDGFDAMLMNLSRLLAEWVMAIDKLPEAPRERLADMGISADPIRNALAREGWAFERKNVVREGEPTMDARLKSILAELLKFEEKLQLPPSPYR
jgi:hypothetical protein